MNRRLSVLVACLSFAVCAAWGSRSEAQPASADAAAEPWFEDESAEGAEALPEPEPYEEADGEAPAASVEASAVDRDPRALTDFEDELAPYGYWVDDPVYGRVWVPSRSVVGAEFAPYVSSGHWAMDTGGNWVWVSDYAFGPVVFHYGRWVWVSGTGWAWVPGRVYAPAWVVWRVPTASSAYVGWAPMPPSYVWMNGVAVSLTIGPSVPYVFCPSAYVFSSHVHYYVVRDRVRIRYLARHTHRYDRHYRRHRYVPHSPTVTRARVPARAVPRRRVAARPALRATAHVSRRAASVRSSQPSAVRTRIDRRAARPSTSVRRSTNLQGAGSGSGQSRATRRTPSAVRSRNATRSSTRATRAPTRRVAPAVRQAPRTQATTRAPASRMRPYTRANSAQSATRKAPSTRAVRRPAPSVRSTPSRPARLRSTPQRSYRPQSTYRQQSRQRSTYRASPRTFSSPRSFRSTRPSRPALRPSVRPRTHRAPARTHRPSRGRIRSSRSR